MTTHASFTAPEQWTERRAVLEPAERALYRAILLAFRATGSVAAADVETLAAASSADVQQARRRFERLDLIRFSEDGDVVVAYPFSGRPTPHLLEFADGRTIYSMCAVDALGVPAMLDEPVTIRSRDPVAGEDIVVHAAPEGDPAVSPPDAVVLVGGWEGGDRPLASICCPVVNFFASRDSGERFLRSKPGLTGSLVPVAEAAAGGRAIFGEALR